MDPVWPAILTNADWQKKKGVIAKIAGKTGVGEAMTSAEKAFKKIDWNKMDARNILPINRDPDKIKAAKAEAIKVYKTVIEPARKELKSLQAVVTKRADEWKKNKAIPASTVQHLQKIAKEADTLSLTLAGNSGGMTARLKSFDDMYAVKMKNQHDEIQKLDETIANLEAALRDAAKTPTKKYWEEGKGDKKSAHQRCRSMCNAIRNIAKLKTKYWKTWEPFGDFYHKSAPDGDQEAAAIQKKIQIVSGELAKFKTAYRRDLA
jgi:DNA repair exonuclease SbcCD ATPase subunit